jgi:hypothetical protein
VEETVATFARCKVPLVALLVSALSIPLARVHAAQQPSRACTPAGSLVALSGLSEASGLAASRRTPGRLWAHNDSGQPILFALDSRGAIVGQVRVTGAKVEDWEAIAVGPCGSGSCVYIGDIGDNEADRRGITVYRVPEPESTSGTAAVSDMLRATYPDGAHDAETLLVVDGRLYVVTKGETGPVAIYRFPAQMKSGATMRLERVGAVTPKRDAESRITDGSVSADGQWVVLRTRSSLAFHRATDLVAGQWRAASTIDVTSLKEPQGEGVAFGSDATLFLAGEGGGKGQPGTFVRFSCALPRA